MYFRPRESVSMLPVAAAALDDCKTTATGDQPGSGVFIGLSLDPSPRGSDIEGEYAEIVNPSEAAVPLEHWWFRDSGLRRYTFPAGAVVPPGGHVTLWMGAGTDTPDSFHWGLTTPPLDNVRVDGHGMGDGGYLFDPRGNVRAWMIYR